MNSILTGGRLTIDQAQTKGGNTRVTVHVGALEPLKTEKTWTFYRETPIDDIYAWMRASHRTWQKIQTFMIGQGLIKDFREAIATGRVEKDAVSELRRELDAQYGAGCTYTSREAQDKAIRWLESQTNDPWYHWNDAKLPGPNCI